MWKEVIAHFPGITFTFSIECLSIKWRLHAHKMRRKFWQKVSSINLQSKMSSVVWKISATQRIYLLTDSPFSFFSNFVSVVHRDRHGRLQRGRINLVSLEKIFLKYKFKKFLFFLYEIKQPETFLIGKTKWGRETRTFDRNFNRRWSICRWERNL